MYWTLDTRRPNLDEIIHEGAQRIRAAVEAVCARYDAPQIEVPEVKRQTSFSCTNPFLNDLAYALSGRMRPGEYCEVSTAESVAAHQHNLHALAARQNMNSSPFPGASGQAVGNPFAANTAFGGLGFSVGCTHDVVIDVAGGRIFRKRGPQYHKPESFGTIAEFR